ncbi:class I adenylate-forming enzyme family protein [Gordonia sp. DT30]|uniref:class I adenylate-forming enzyme family protein n=1 Tax=Gordonia sp. DT30 TaxID=3416546 RepID=UPI003CED321C
MAVRIINQFGEKMSMTVSHAVRWWAREKAQQKALVVGAESVTFGELENWTSRVARHLAQQGIAPGDRIGVIGRNSVNWAIAAIAIVKLGAVLVPMNNRFKERELEVVVARTTPRLVLGDESFEATFTNLAVAHPELAFESLESIRELETGEPDTFRLDLQPNDPMIIMMTSGSTGQPKGVVYTNASVLGMIFEWSLMEETVRPGVRIFLPIPFAFAPGTVWGLMRTMTLGGTLFFQEKFDAADAVRLLQDNDIDISLGGPIIYEQMSQTPEFESAEFPRLRTAITGGARVPVDLLQKWMKKGLRIRQLYGMSEVGGITTATKAEDAFDHPDTCGRGGVFSEFRVVREDGTECDPMEQGEILSRGPGMMSHYWDDPTQTAKTLVDGWIRSGDVGFTTPDGRLKFIDRSKDLIISGGINISPAEIEGVIGRMDGVDEVVVLAAKDQKYGEVPAAVVKINDGTTVQDVLDECNKQLADFKIPRYIVERVDPLPRLAHGKISKIEVRQEYSDIHTQYTRVR